MNDEPRPAPRLVDPYSTPGRSPAPRPVGPLVCIGWLLFVILLGISPALVLAGWRLLL